MPGPERRLILASGSPARLRLLRAAGFDPEVRLSGVDEDAFGAPTPEALVLELATCKANAVAAELVGQDVLVLGCDSVLDVDGVVHGKPETEDEARARLQRLRGRSAVLRTGHCLIDAADGREVSAVAATTVWFGEYTDDELDAYLATGEAMEVAGAFTLDGRSGPFVAGVEGDPSNVIGLSLPLFRDLLGQLGLSVTDLWV